MWYNALIVSFPVGQLPGHPRELFFMTNKSHLKPLGRGNKINANNPFLGGSMNTHNIHLLLILKNNVTTFFNLLLSDQSIIFTFIGKNNKQMYPIFCMLFAHFHTLTMVPSKALFTLPVAQCLKQILWVC